jgi:putative redox protein
VLNGSQHIKIRSSHHVAFFVVSKGLLHLSINLQAMATTSTIYLGDLRTEMTHIQSGTVVVTDAPIDNKGKGAAFSPTDLLASAFGSCMLTIMGISGREHGFSIDGTKATITKIMASNPRRVAEVHVTLDFPDIDYSDKHKAIIKKISETCPVALSLHQDLKQVVQLNFKR